MLRSPSFTSADMFTTIITAVALIIFTNSRHDDSPVCKLLLEKWELHRVCGFSGTNRGISSLHYVVLIHPAVCSAPVDALLLQKLDVAKRQRAEVVVACLLKVVWMSLGLACFGPLALLSSQNSKQYSPKVTSDILVPLFCSFERNPRTSPRTSAQPMNNASPTDRQRTATPQATKKRRRQKRKRYSVQRLLLLKKATASVLNVCYAFPLLPWNHSYQRAASAQHSSEEP